ncbi:MAG: glycosyltransferase family 2 protein [Clostridia bacterium]|nr:glycosyltransferase family 2 protein [Clostridia bacterium]
MKILSIVVPCYNEEKALPYFYDEINKISKDMGRKYRLEFEFVFVDDGSKDNTANILKNMADTDSRVKFISFSRNFGKEAALLAGLQYSSGDYTAVMDADLQDPPEMLIDMYEALTNEDYDCAAARRVTRKGEPKIRSWFAKKFYKLINKISNADIEDGARDFRLMKRCVVDAILSMKEYNRFSKGIFGWVGFKTKWIDYENVKRVAGDTKWSFTKLLLYSIDGIVAFSTVPLSVAAFLGILFCFIAFVMILVIITKTLIWGDPVAGYPSMVCIIFLLSGVQLFTIGILGQYIAKTYMETKHRPQFIIRETNCAKNRYEK